MEKRKWYDMGIETSLLGFGAMRLKTVDGEIDEELGFKLFDMAYNAGINYFDTALPYTDRKNEIFVGKALKRYPRDSFYLASKLSLFCFDTPEEAKKSVDMQLERLQTDYIDFYLVHALNRNSFQRFKGWNMLETVLEWKKQGKIRHIGFSFHDSYDVFEDILNYYDGWEFVQIQLNYMDTDIQQGIKGYELLKERKIPVVVMEPVKGGKLAAFNEKAATPFKEYSDASLASWALRWVGSLPGVKVLLSGMNSEEQVIDNLNTFNNFKPLNEEEQKRVLEVRDRIKKLTAVGCTACEYCMPCPAGVNIPRNFSIFNDYYMYMNRDSANWAYQGLAKNNAGASSCVECRSCVDKCPQHIDIPEKLKEMMKEMDFLFK